jgi:cytochrome c553
VLTRNLGRASLEQDLSDKPVLCIATSLFNEAIPMIRKIIATILVGWLGSIGAAEAAGDAAAGKAKAAMCSGCHGEKGEGVAPNPALAGKPEADQIKALKDYKSGARANPIMSGMAAMLSDQDMENLAAYYASLK